MKKKLIMFPILITIVFSIFLANIKPFQVANATYVEGPITKDTVWTLAESPFVVSQDATVYPNATLTIEPGVEVRFGGFFSLIVSGKLYANGTQSAIKFTSNKQNPASGDWRAIEFNGTGKSTLTDCFVAYAEAGISVDNGNVEITESTITLSQNGINVTDGQVIAKNNIITDNLGNGVSITGNGQVTLENNTIMTNSNGILLTGIDASNLSIRWNKISTNTNNGIQIDAANHTNIVIADNVVSSNGIGFYISSPTSTSISNNSISYNNVGFLYDEGSHAANYNDIYSNQMGMDVSSNATVDAEHNYWGDPSGPYHASLNPYGRGNPVGGDGVNIIFIFYLTKPIGYVNARPTANLLNNKVWVRPNENVMFFATNSYDTDGRVDKYFFNFNDGKNSGWTTLSIFTHIYSTPGTYYASLTVMDDYGATSTAVNTTIHVQNLPPLYANVVLSSSTTPEKGQVSVVAYVTNGTVPVDNSAVTLFSVKGGEFTQSNGNTNASGYFVTTFTSPDVIDVSNVRVVVRASKAGYADGTDYKYLEVSPFLAVQITSPEKIVSEGNATITIHVESNGYPVSNSSVTVSADTGKLSPETGTTDLNGAFSLAFTAPQTTSFLNATITTVATKDKYMTGTVQAEITIEPKIPIVTITTASVVTFSEARLNITVHAEYNMIPLAGANVAITADNGNFSTSTGLADTYGNVTFYYTAPLVNQQSTVTITARATMVTYAEGQDQLKITVNPRTFNIQIIAPEMTSGESPTVNVQVTCKEDGSTVANATVTVSSSEGSFPLITKTTDQTGMCPFVFNAPQTTSELSITIVANATKSGYAEGGGQLTVTVAPEVAPQGGGGWPWWTILLILIPVAIVVIVVVLIKLKVISLSSEEEQS